MNDVFAGHLSEASEDAFEDEFALADGVFGEVVEAATDGVAFDVLEGEVD